MKRRALPMKRKGIWILVSLVLLELVALGFFFVKQTQSTPKEKTATTKETSTVTKETTTTSTKEKEEKIE